METSKIKGWYELEHIRDGKVLKKWSVDNSIMNAGFAQLALLAGDASATPFTYLALGTSSTAVAPSQTALQAETAVSGLTRASATVSRVTTTQTNDTLQLYKVFTNAGATTVIEEVGIFNDPTTGTMLSRALTGTTTLIAGDQFSETYKIRFS